MAQLAGGEPASPPRHEFTNDVVVNTGTDARTEGSHTTTAADICKEDVGSNCSDQAEDDELKGGTDDQKFEGRQCDKNVKIIQSPKIEFTCDICGKELKSSKSLMEHKFLHSAAHATFRCPECDKLLATRATLREHLRWHEGVPRVPCDVCGKLLANEESRRKHVRAVHDKVSTVNRLFTSSC